MFSLFRDDKEKDEKKNSSQETMCVDKKVTIRGPKLGDTKTIIIGPNGKDARVMEGEW